MFAAAGFAQNAVWESSIASFEATDLFDQNSPAAMDKDGNLYVTGSQTTSFKFAGNDVDVLALGAYIAKYDATGKELFAITLHGSITITAITTDADNNLYVAGKFAGEAYIADVEGIEGDYETITNSEPDSKTASFIAKYDSNGNLLNVKSFEAEMPSHYDTKSVIFNKVVVNDSKVYVSLAYNANVVLAEGVTLVAKSRVLDLGGFPLELGWNNHAVIAFDKNLASAEIIAELSRQEACAEATDVLSFNFAVENNDVYVAAVGMGDLLFTAASDTQNVSYAVGDGTSEQGAFIVKVGSGLVKYSNVSNTNSYPRYTIAGMEVKDGVAYLAGTFSDTNPFDNEKVAVGTHDVFVTADGVKVYTSEYAEDKCTELVGGFFVTANKTYMINVIWNADSKSCVAVKNYEIDNKSGECKVNDGVYTTASAFNEDYLAIINCTDKTYINVYNAEGFATGIDEVVVEGENNAIYDLTGRRIEQVTKPGIYIVNGVKKLVK